MSLWGVPDGAAIRLDFARVSVNHRGMFWYLALLLLSPIYSVVLRLVRDDPDREILALRQQVLVLQRQLGKRPQLSHGDRLALLLSCVNMKKRQLAIVLGLVAAMTLTALPLLAGCLARLLDGRLGVSVTGWLAIFGFGLLIFAAAGGYLAWRRFRRRFVGLEQTIEELREDLVWLGEWTGRDVGDRDA